MTNRFLISVAALALIAGTGAASAQGTGRPRIRRGRDAERARFRGGGAAGGATTQNRESTRHLVRHDLDAVGKDVARCGQGPTRPGNHAGARSRRA